MFEFREVRGRFHFGCPETSSENSKSQRRLSPRAQTTEEEDKNCLKRIPASAEQVKTYHCGSSVQPEGIPRQKHQAPSGRKVLNRSWSPPDRSHLQGTTLLKKFR